MVLLFGGTSDTAPIAEALAAAGYRVLVSTATDAPLAIGSHPAIGRRFGRLDALGMRRLIAEKSLEAIVDASHPYAVELRETAAGVARELCLPYFAFLRPSAPLEGAISVSDHAAAARVAFSFGRPVLLTTGSRHLVPYAEESRRTGIPLVVRVLDHPDSHAACAEAGIPPEQIVLGRGPFGVRENRELIRKYTIGVLVTKESGDAGGVPEKLEAARAEGCTVVAVGRPETDDASAVSTVGELIEKIRKRIPPRPVLAIDLESVLAPEIWESIARKSGVPELAATTRDIPDYGDLMAERIRVCREHGLTLARLADFAETIKPLTGASDFLRFAETRLEVRVISDTFPELANPVVSRLGSPVLFCNRLTVDTEGFITGYVPRDPGGKAGAIRAFQNAGQRVLAVGDSFNDLEMLHAAEKAFLFRPSSPVHAASPTLPTLDCLDRLRMEVVDFVQGPAPQDSNL